MSLAAQSTSVRTQRLRCSGFRGLTPAFGAGTPVEVMVPLDVLNQCTVSDDASEQVMIFCTADGALFDAVVCSNLSSGFLGTQLTRYAYRLSLPVDRNPHRELKGTRETIGSYFTPVYSKRL